MKREIRKSEFGDQWFIVSYDEDRWAILRVFYSLEKAENYIGEYYEKSIG